MISLDNLAVGHLDYFRRSLDNLLSTNIAEFTYAQIIDGLPTKDVYRQSHWNLEGLPVLDHLQLCDGILDKTRHFRSNFDVKSLFFMSKTLQAYQNTELGSVACKLRLLELLAIATHQIAVYLYNLDDGFHKNSEYEAKFSRTLEQIPLDLPWERELVPPLTLFFNSYYRDFEQYPDKVADVVGYWAESRIFGGVVLFDRGETDEECDGVYLHGDTVRHGYTIYPPSEAQFTELMDFLSSSSPNLSQCPLPVQCTRENRYRWDPYEAMAYYHIFRDRYERKLPEHYVPPDKRSVKDWPEIEDMHVDFEQQMAQREGRPVDEQAWQAAKAGLLQITPSSFAWHWEKPTKMKGRMLGKPTYFSDP